LAPSSGDPAPKSRSEALPVCQWRCKRRCSVKWYLVDLLGNGEDDGPITLLRDLGISAVLVETRQAARRAIRNIIKAAAQHSGPLGFDIETCPKPEYAKERPWAKFNKDGAFSDAQPSPKDYRDPAGIDPHRADIATAQIYAGGSTCFVFRGEAWCAAIKVRKARQSG
jgi:hypothetical protein